MRFGCENERLQWKVFFSGRLKVEKTLSGAGEDCFRGLYEVSLALVGVASPAYFLF
jgi:hypothetical protein